jgi:5-formyltetrahydrofolate cyclo-ligase
VPVSTEINRAKQSIRELTWDLLDARHASFPPAWDTIPAFDGAELAAQRLARTDAWRRARVVVVNPDLAQRPVGALALAAGKALFLAVPRMATVRPFYRLTAAAFAAGAAGPPPGTATVGAAQMPPVDLAVCGSVAVSANGARLGKGAGYSDLEFALLAEAGRITDGTTIATTVHALQVVDRPLPEAAHDFRVDVVVTPQTVICCPRARRPQGLVWDNLTQDKISEIAVLADLAAARPGGQRDQRGPPGAS